MSQPTTPIILGRGAYGWVFQDPEDPEKAIKDLDFRSIDFSVLRELYAMTLPPHPDLIRMDSVRDLEKSYSSIVMPKALFDLQSKMKTLAFELTLGQLAGIFYQIFCGLDALHTMGLVHSDIKPSNVLVFSWGKENEVPDVKLSDFGLIQLKRSPVHKGPNEMITSIYRPPDHLCIPEDKEKDFELSYASDIYSAGIMMLNLLETWASGSVPDPDFIACKNPELCKRRTAEKLAQMLGADQEEWTKYCGLPDFKVVKSDDNQLFKSPHPSPQIDSEKRRSMSLFKVLHDLAMYAVQFDRTKRPEAWQMTDLIEAAMKVELDKDDAVKLPVCPRPWHMPEFLALSLQPDEKGRVVNDVHKSNRELINLFTTRIKGDAELPVSYYNAVERIPPLIDSMKVDDKLRSAAFLALISWLPPNEHTTYNTWKRVANTYLSNKKLFPTRYKLRNFYNWLLTRKDIK